MIETDLYTNLPGQCSPGNYYCNGWCQSVPCYFKESITYDVIFAVAAGVLGAALWSAYAKDRANLPNSVRGQLSVAFAIALGVICGVAGSVLVRAIFSRPGIGYEWAAAIVIGFAVPYIFLGVIVKGLAMSDNDPSPGT
jgi:H+/Cl- antiporter ClcA